MSIAFSSLSLSICSPFRSKDPSRRAAARNSLEQRDQELSLRYREHRRNPRVVLDHVRQQMRGQGPSGAAEIKLDGSLIGGWYRSLDKIAPIEIGDHLRHVRTLDPQSAGQNALPNAGVLVDGQEGGRFARSQSDALEILVEHREQLIWARRT